MGGSDARYFIFNYESGEFIESVLMDESKGDMDCVKYAEYQRSAKSIIAIGGKRKDITECENRISTYCSSTEKWTTLDWTRSIVRNPVMMQLTKDERYLIVISHRDVISS